MFDNPRDAFAIAESMLGYSFNTEDEQEFKNCADLLATQSPVLQGYVMDQIFDRMERGEAWAAPDLCPTAQYAGHSGNFQVK